MPSMYISAPYGFDENEQTAYLSKYWKLTPLLSVLMPAGSAGDAAAVAVMRAESSRSSKTVGIFMNEFILNTSVNRIIDLCIFSIWQCGII